MKKLVLLQFCEVPTQGIHKLWVKMVAMDVFLYDDAYRNVLRQLRHIPVLRREEGGCRRGGSKGMG